MKKNLPLRTLVIGGAASGKSRWAEAFVLKSEIVPTYVATAQAFDDEMIKKIDIHRSRRDARWTVIEEPLRLEAAILNCPTGSIALIDCAPLWLSNHLLGGSELDAESGQFGDMVTNTPVPVVIVTNEVGDGIVPSDAITRQFRQAHGHMIQVLAAQCDLVVRVTAGLPMTLKGTLPV